MASAFETALTGIQDDVVELVGEATPFMIAIAGVFIVFRLTKRVVNKVL